MTFPVSHKTVFVLDHTLSAVSGVKLDLETLSKSRSSSGHPHPPPHHIPLLPVSKTIWTCAVEALTEYCRIVWDIFPTSRLIRFIAIDKNVHKLNNGWNIEDQNLASLMNNFINLGAPKSNIKIDFEKGLKCAVEALAEPTTIQHEKRSALNENATKVLNKGRILLVTKFDQENEFFKIKEKFHDILLQMNKTAATTDKLMPINHCELILVNFCKEDCASSLANRIWSDYSPFLSCEIFNLRCGTSLAPRLCSLVLKNYELASTTVTGIPMKEEQNASSSANYDVELFHPAAAHTAILKGIPSETAHLKTVRDGTDYETVTLKWCTPRSNASMELQHCSSAYRITSVDVNSRPSSCLTNFLLNGRWVMLEMPRKSGSKVISHMLACHGGDIYIHTMFTTRSILEDPPSISEGCGGRVTDYRIPDFGDFIKSSMLAPHPSVVLEEGEDCTTPLDRGRDLIKRHTRFWPITLSNTYLFSLGQTVEPLSRLMVKDLLSEDEVVECKNVVFALMNIEAKGESLPSPSVNQRGKGIKKEEQYKSLWSELEQYLRSHLHSSTHEKILECLLECQNKSSSNQDKSEEKVDIDQALMEIDNIDVSREKEVQNNSKPPLDLSDKRRRPNSNPQTETMGKKSKLNLLTLLENKVNSELSQKCPEFQGRLKAENNKTKLYPNFQKEKEKDNSRKK